MLSSYSHSTIRGFLKDQDTDCGVEDWRRFRHFVLHNSGEFAILRSMYPDIQRVLVPPQENIFLLGPRGTGKTWWTQRTFPDALRIDLLNPEEFRLFASRPERLRERIDAGGSSTIIIDEVQKLPSLLEMAHLLIEERRGHRFIFTGSSARKLRRNGVNLLGGRASQRTLHPFMAAELGDLFDLNLALKCGMIPVILNAKDPLDAIRAYNGLYIREEVQAEGLVRSTENFARFLEAISFSQASVLNLSNVARECQVHRKTVEGYLDILEDLLLAFRVPVFAKHAKRDMAVHPKFFYFDVGVYRANRPSGPLDAPSEIDGVALESLVAQHLRAWCDYSSGNHTLSYWRTRANREVDFVVYGESGLYAIEVKNSSSIRPEYLQGLLAFADDYPSSKRFLLYRGKDRLVRNGVLCMPCEDFLRALVLGCIPHTAS